MRVELCLGRAGGGPSWGLCMGVWCSPGSHRWATAHTNTDALCLPLCPPGLRYMMLPDPFPRGWHVGQPWVSNPHAKGSREGAACCWAVLPFPGPGWLSADFHQASSLPGQGTSPRPMPAFPAAHAVDPIQEHRCLGKLRGRAGTGKD